MTHSEKRELFVTRSSLPPFDDYIEEIRPLWDTHFITNMGEKHQKLQSELEEFLDVDNCILFANGHSALEMTLAAFGFEGEAITVPFTFASTTHAIVRAGLDPIMCDVRRADGTIDPNCIEPLITERTSVIVPVHVFGNICDVEAIEAIASKHGIKVVYDAAHAFGEFAGKRSVTSWGDASIISFHATKVFNCIEGGAVCCNGNDELVERLNLLKNFGIVDEENVEAIGANAKLSEFHAAMGLCNLRLFSDQIALRAEANARYRKRLGQVKGLRFLAPLPSADTTANYSYLAVTVDEHVEGGRDALFDALAKQGIHARKYFYPCTNAYACYRTTLDPSSTPVAKMLSEQVICLPMFAGITREEVDSVCDAVIGHLATVGR